MTKRFHNLPVILLSSLITLTVATHGRRSVAQTQSAKDEASTAEERKDLPQLTLQLGHTGMVNAVSFSSDGQFVLTGSAAGFTDNSVILWSVASVREIRRFRVEHGAKSLQFLPGAYLFVTIDDEDGKTILWNAETGEALHEFDGDAPAVSPDGRLLLTRNAQEVIAWTAATGKNFKKFQSPQKVNSVGFSPDGRAVIETSNREVIFWDIEKDKEAGRLKGLNPRFSANGQRAVTQLEKESVLWNAVTHQELRRFPGVAPSISRDGGLLITNDSKQTVLWSLTTNQVLQRFAGDSAQISPDNRLVVTEDGGERVIWSAVTGKELHRFHHEIDGVTDVRFSGNGRFFLTEGDSERGTMPGLWDAIKISEIREMPSFDSTSATFSPDDRFVLTGSRNKLARLWDAASGLEVKRFEGLTAYVSLIDFPVNGRLLQINSVHESGGIVDSLAAHLWNLSSGQEVRHFEGIPDTANSAALSPDGKLAATGGSKNAHLWEIATGREIRFFIGHADKINSIRFSPNGRALATASEDGTARLWELSTGKELRTLIGHRAGVSAVRFSHDGRLVLTGSADGTVRLWSVATGKEIRRYGEHGSALISVVYSVAFSPDDRYVLAGCAETNNLANEDEIKLEYSARLWNLTTGAELKRFKHSEPVMSVAISPNGLSLLTASADTAVRVWNIRAGEITRTLKKDFDVGMFADYSPDGRFILAGGFEVDNRNGSATGSRASLWNAATGEEVRSFVIGSANDTIPLFATINANFSSDGRFLITQGIQTKPSSPGVEAAESDSPETSKVTGRAMAQVWEVATGKEICRFGRDRGDPDAIKFSPDTNSISISRTDQSSINVLDAVTARVRNVITDSAGAINDLAYSPDGLLIAGGSDDGATYVWDTQTQKLAHRFQDLSAGADWNTSVSSVGFGSAGLTAWIFVDGRLFLAETNSGSSFDLFESVGASKQESWGLDPRVKFVSAASAPGDQVVSLGDSDGTIHLIQLVGNLSGTQLHGHTGAITSMAFSPEGEKLASASTDKSVRLWVLSTHKQVQLLQHFAPVTEVAFSGDGRFILTLSGASAWLWDATNGKQIRQLSDPNGITAIGFLGVTGRIVTGGQDGTLRMWDATTGAQLLALKGHTGRINSVAISPDGKFLISGSADTTSRLWDVTKAAEVRRFEGHTDAVTSVAISQDKRYLITGSADKTVRLWDIEKGTATRRFEKRAGSVQSVAFSQDGRFLLTGGIRLEGFSGSGEPKLGGGAQLWDLKTMKLVRSFGTGPVVYTALSLDGKYVLTAIGSRSAGGLTGIGGVEIWKVDDGTLVKPMNLEDYVPSVALSPDGKSILTGTPFVDPQEDPTVETSSSQANEAVLIQVDQKDDEEGRKFTGHSFPVNKVAFSPDSRFIVTGSMDGTSAFWDIATGKQVCRLIPLRDGTWVVLDKEGRFDTNNLEEMKGLHWVFADDPMKPLPLEIYMRDYYQPRLLPSLLSGKPLVEIKPLASLNRVQPLVKITKVEPSKLSRQSNVIVTVEVANVRVEQTRDGKRIIQESGVFDLRLFRDGQLVGYVPGELKLDNNGKATAQLPVRLRGDLPNEKVEFTAYAFNAERIKSAAASYSYERRPQLNVAKGRAYVISVGVNAYEDESLDLNFAARDAQLSQQVMTKKLSATGHYSDVIPITLTSDYSKEPTSRTVTERLATKQNLRTVLDLLAHGLAKAGAAALGQIPGAEKLRKVQPEDLVLLIFSSHGYTDRQGKFYLIPYDTGRSVEFAPGGDIAPSSLAHFISSDELSQWFREIDAGELALIVDTCHSAAAVDAEGFKPGPMGSRGMGQLAYDKGMRILAASQADDVALELDRLQQGLLTYALMEEGLNQKRADTNGDGRIMLDEWLDYGVERVPTLYEDVKAGRVEKLRSKDVHITSVISGDSVKRNAFQQPQLFDFKRKRREVILQ